MNVESFIDGLLKSKELKEFEEKIKTVNANFLEKKPVDLDTFIFSKDYLGLEKISPKQAKLLIALDNLSVEDNPYKEYVVVVGKGGGKDLMISLANHRFAYRLALEGPPADYTGIDLGLPITILNVAVNAEQANSVYFETFKTVGKNIFKRLGCKVLAGEVQFPNNINVVSGHSEAEGMEGYNLFSCVLDEIAAFKTNAELRGKSLRSKQSADYLYNMAKSSVKSRFPKTGKIVMISYPRFESDFILQKYEEGLRRPDVYTEFAKTWEFNPYSNEEDFEDERKLDPKEWAAKYCCMPPKAKDAYFADENRVRAIVDSELHNPWAQGIVERLENSFFGKGLNYYIGLDLALKHDRAGLAMCHREFGEDKKDYYIIVDLLKTWEAPKGGEIDFEDIRALIYLLKQRQFNIRMVLTDSFQSADMKQVLTKAQIPTENKYSCDKGKKVYDTAKDLINRGKLKVVNCKYTNLLVEELLALSLITNKKIDHPMGGSKDLADATALAIFADSLQVASPAFCRNW